MKDCCFFNSFCGLMFSLSSTALTASCLSFSISCRSVFAFCSGRLLRPFLPDMHYSLSSSLSDLIYLRASPTPPTSSSNSLVCSLSFSIIWCFLAFVCLFILPCLSFHPLSFPSALVSVWPFLSSSFISFLQLFFFFSLNNTSLSLSRSFHWTLHLTELRPSRSAPQANGLTASASKWGFSSSVQFDASHQCYIWSLDLWKVTFFRYFNAFNDYFSYYCNELF